MTNKPTDFQTALKISFEHMRDVSIRDGVQSWDANKWKIEDIRVVATALNHLAQVAKHEGVDMPPVEAWGGGQVAQPAKFLGEDPLINLEKIHEAAPDLTLQALYRGRQAYGFIPVSEEIQRAALEASVKRGIKVVRIFDMMNDITNVEPGIRILNELKKKYDGVQIEGAISYISERSRKNEARAWELTDYADYAVQLAKTGVDEIAIKNYAGVGDKEMPALIKAIRKALKDAGFEGMKVNLHDHGAKPDVLAAAVKAGADKVDVAYGLLSDGTSHSNAIDTLKALLNDQGFDVDADKKLKKQFDANPLVQAMREVEAVIEEKAQKYQAKRGTPLTQKQMDEYRMAGGAFSDLWQNYYNSDAVMNAAISSWKKASATAKDKQDVFGDIPPVPNNKEEWRDTVLDLGKQLWQKAGRFNTVTPGANILTRQAVKLTEKRLLGQNIDMTDYTPQYLDIATGRYGANRGMDKGVGDVAFRDAALMFRALLQMNEAIIADKLPTYIASKLVQAAGFKTGSDEGSVRFEFTKGRSVVNVKNPNLEAILKNHDINQFRQAVQDSKLPDDIRQKLMRELTPGKAPDPTISLADGKAIADKLCPDHEALRNAGKPISDGDDLALMAVLFRNRDPQGNITDEIFQKMTAAIRGSALVAETPKADAVLAAKANGQAAARG